MLMRLHFVSSDEYAAWLRQELENRLSSPIAVFAIRKFDRSVKCIWDDSGEVVERPAQSQGSEDLVHSVIANVKKNAKDNLLDHPSLDDLKKSKVRNLVLIDDSIGSGSRVKSYIQRMLSNPKFLSWWNYGFIRLHVVAFARTVEGQELITSAVGGSNHHKRKFPISTKLQFAGLYCYPKRPLRQRWGPAWQHVRDAARSCSRIPANRRLGFDGTMANFVFFHSVPNNIPGVLWFDREGWKPLFPQRSLPSWAVELLLDKNAAMGAHERTVSVSHQDPPEVLSVLGIVKSGYRIESRIAWRAGLDTKVTSEILSKLRTSGLISLENRLTEAGNRMLKQPNKETHVAQKSGVLYIPTQWCADQEEVQPLELRSESSQDQAESVSGIPASDGEAGQVSLERTDAKTAAPSMDVETETPSADASWNGPDIHGPKG